MAIAAARHDERNRFLSRLVNAQLERRECQKANARLWAIIAVLVRNGLG